MQHRRIVAFFVALGGAALLASACDDGGGHHRQHGRHGQGGACRAATTCGACTPIVGCGWCFTPEGGTCVDGPDDCPSDATGWTWDPPGCDGDGGATDAGEEASDAGEAGDVVHVPADASVGSSDGG